VRWTVRNAGVGPTVASGWNDRLFWSGDTQLGEQKYIALPY